MSFPSASASPRDAHAQKMLDTLARYTAKFPERPGSLQDRKRKQGEEVILLTGTTGGFGCNILGQLSLDSSVKKIYALNRSSSRAGLMSRQLKALEQRGVLDECLSSDKFQLVEADLSKEYLGLSQELYDEIRNTVTHIIHNAWSVNLVKPLEFFEECFQGLRNIVDLALASPFVEPPKLLFVSSMGMLRNYPGLEPALEEPLPDPSVATGFGYTESKWIAERILVSANEKTGLPITTVRVGILCGDRNGHWGTNDMYPLIVKSSITLGCLPDPEGDGPVSWVPSWEGAAALCAMRYAKEPVLHLANPNPIPWRNIFQIFAEEMGVPLVPFPSWISLLQNDSNHQSTSRSEIAKRNPAVRLLPYFLAADLREHREPVGHTRFNTKKAIKVAPMLNDIRIGPELAERWIDGWREDGFLPSTGRRKGIAGKIVDHLARL